MTSRQVCSVPLMKTSDDHLMTSECPRVPLLMTFLIRRALAVIATECH